MAQNKVNPLTYSVPIVNKDGTPTVEFMRKWAQQATTNGIIPDLSTAAAVSAILDLIGATEGSVLVRGSAEWEARLPGTTGQVLTIVGGVPDWADPTGGGVAIGTGAPTALEPAGTLYSQDDAAAVWSSQPTGGGLVAHWEQIGGGGTPTTFYPGLDQIMDRWPLDLNGITLSAGGGGGGSAGFVYTWTGLIGASPSGSSFATKGTVFTALSDFEIDELFAIIQPGSTSETYSMGLYEVSTASGPVIVSVVYQQTPASPANTNNQTWRSGAVTLSLTAGKRYALAISRRDATDTDAAPIFPTSGAENSFPGAPIDYSKSEGPNCFVTLAKKTPAPGDAFSTPASNSYAVGMKAKVTT